jgi:hypothetical protein
MERRFAKAKEWSTERCPGYSGVASSGIIAKWFTTELPRAHTAKELTIL